LDRLLEKYKGRIKLVYYHITFSDRSYKAAEAALCAGTQGKYWEYHDKLFDLQTQWSNAANPISYFEGYAKELGLNENKFESCMDEGSVAEMLEKDKNIALSRNVRSTPTIFIGGKRIVGAQPFFLYKRVIDGLLK